MTKVKFFLFYLVFTSLIFAEYAIDNKYFYINGTNFAFFGWLIPYNSQGADQKPIVWRNFNQEISLSPFFDCSKSYKICSSSYVKYFYLPYLYWRYVLKTNFPYSNLKLEYSGELDSVFKKNFEVDDSQNYGVNVLFNKINNKVYYKDLEVVYMSFLPDNVLIDSNTNLTNTQYYFKENPKFKIISNYENITLNSLSYPLFYLYNGSISGSTNMPINTNLENVKIFMPNPETNKGPSTGSYSRGKIKLDFTSLIKAGKVNRFYGVEYQPVVKWAYQKNGLEISGTSESKLKSYYTFVKGPNTVVYLESIKVK